MSKMDTIKSLIERVLIELLMAQGNSMQMYTLVIAEDYNSLILNLLKTLYDIRWCSNEWCSCHPETHLRHLVGRDRVTPLVAMLIDLKVYEDIQYIIKYSNQKITVYDNYE